MEMHTQALLNIALSSGNEHTLEEVQRGHYYENWVARPPSCWTLSWPPRAKERNWEALMAICCNPPGIFQFLLLISGEGISTAFANRKLKRSPPTLEKSLWSLKGNTSGVSRSDFSAGIGQQLTGCTQSTPFVLSRCFGQQLRWREHMGWQGSLWWYHFPTFTWIEYPGSCISWCLHCSYLEQL